MTCANRRSVAHAVALAARECGYLSNVVRRRSRPGSRSTSAPCGVRSAVPQPANARSVDDEPLTDRERVPVAALACAIVAQLRAPADKALKE